MLFFIKTSAITYILLKHLTHVLPKTKLGFVQAFGLRG